MAWALRAAVAALCLAAGACAQTVTRHPEFGADCAALDADVDCVTVYYGTSRALELADGGAAAAGGEADVSRGTERAGDGLTLGRADVWLPRLGDRPDDRRRGETPLAVGAAPTDRAEQERYVFITRITAQGRERFVQDLQSAVDDEGDGAVLLFVHGFNVGFDSALIRSAQLTVDLRDDAGFNPGAPVLFTWPSQGRMSVSAYRADERAAAAAQPRLDEFLDLLTGELRVRRVNIIAHSMGNRVLTGGLEAFAADYLARRPERPIEFRIILAAADIEADIYALAAEHIAGLQPNVTIYTSDADRALQFSRLINGVKRLGETDVNRPFIRADSGYATIDATPVATELFGVGHGYYSDNPFILNDIRCAMADRPTAARALQLRRYADAPNGDLYFRADPDAEPVTAACALRRDRFPVSASGEVPPGPPPAPPPPPPTAPPPILPPPPAPPADRAFAAYFDTGRSALSAQAEAAVDEAAAHLARIGEGRIVLIGHADSIGSARGNDALARRRAEAVRARLIALGVDPARIVVEARGEREPAVGLIGGGVEPLNRRVEIRVEGLRE